MAAGSVTQKINISLPEDAVSSFVQRGADLVLVLANGEERVIRNVYSDPAQASEAQLVFEDGAVRDVPSMGLGDSFSTAEIFSTKAGAEGTSDPMVLPAMGAATNFLGGNDAAAAGAAGLAFIALAARDNDNGPESSAPNAVNDVSNGPSEGARVIDVLANDVEGEPGNNDLTIIDATDPQGGTVDISDDGKTVTYTPDGSQNAPDQFSYTIREEETGKTDTGTVTVNFDDPPTPPSPEATDDSADVDLNQAQTINVLANDDPGAGALTITSFTMPANGTVERSDDGQGFVYTPNENYFGPDSFSYTVTDSETGETSSADVTVNVVAPPPDAADDTASATTGQSQTIDVLANDEEGVPGNDDLVITDVEEPENGSVTIAEDGKTIVYTSDAGFEGEDRIAYTITETETGETATAFVDVTVGDPGLLDFALADGGLLGEVTGNSGLLGDVTGSDGVLGDLLGTGGTLGDVGGAEGLVGDLTGLTLLGDGSGDDAILDPLVADEGALGELTGDNGLLADVSGASGLVGDLVTNGGTLGDVTGIDGLVGDLTGRDTLSEPTGEDVSAGDDGLLDGLLGGGEGDGLLDGLLGGGEGDGLLDGVLGGDESDGLLDGLLGSGEGEGLLDPIVADGGLLGEVTGDDGLLGDVTGVNGVLGDLVGNDGALSDITGEDGLVGDLTGTGLIGGSTSDGGDGDGLLDGVLGGGDGDGLLDGVLGGGEGDGLLDGVLGGGEGDGLLDGVLGGGEGDGLLDGVLGGGDGDGLLDGVLGGGEGDGLLDGVLGGGEGDGLLDGLLGGDGGLLGGLTGDTGADGTEAA